MYINSNLPTYPHTINNIYSMLFRINLFVGETDENWKLLKQEYLDNWVQKIYWTLVQIIRLLDAQG